MIDFLHRTPTPITPQALASINMQPKAKSQCYYFSGLLAGKPIHVYSKNNLLAWLGSFFGRTVAVQYNQQTLYVDTRDFKLTTGDTYQNLFTKAIMAQPTESITKALKKYDLQKKFHAVQLHDQLEKLKPDKTVTIEIAKDDVEATQEAIKSLNPPLTHLLELSYDNESTLLSIKLPPKEVVTPQIKKLLLAQVTSLTSVKRADRLLSQTYQPICQLLTLLDRFSIQASDLALNTTTSTEASEIVPLFNALTIELTNSKSHKELLVTWDLAKALKIDSHLAKECYFKFMCAAESQKNSAVIQELQKHTPKVSFTPSPEQPLNLSGWPASAAEHAIDKALQDILQHVVPDENNDAINKQLSHTIITCDTPEIAERITTLLQKKHCRLNVKALEPGNQIVLTSYDSNQAAQIKAKQLFEEEFKKSSANQTVLVDILHKLQLGKIQLDNTLCGELLTHYFKNAPQKSVEDSTAFLAKILGCAQKKTIVQAVLTQCQECLKSNQPQLALTLLNHTKQFIQPGIDQQQIFSLMQQASTSKYQVVEDLLATLAPPLKLENGTGANSTRIDVSGWTLRTITPRLLAFAATNFPSTQETEPQETEPQETTLIAHNSADCTALKNSLRAQFPFMYLQQQGNQLVLRMRDEKLFEDESSEANQAFSSLQTIDVVLQQIKVLEDKQLKVTTTPCVIDDLLRAPFTASEMTQILKALLKLRFKPTLYTCSEAIYTRLARNSAEGIQEAIAFSTILLTRDYLPTEPTTAEPTTLDTTVLKQVVKKAALLGQGIELQPLLLAAHTCNHIGFATLMQESITQLLNHKQTNEAVMLLIGLAEQGIDLRVISELQPALQTLLHACNQAGAADISLNLLRTYSKTTPDHNFIKNCLQNTFEDLLQKDPIDENRLKMALQLSQELNLIDTLCNQLFLKPGTVKSARIGALVQLMQQEEISLPSEHYQVALRTFLQLDKVNFLELGNFITAVGDPIEENLRSAILSTLEPFLLAILNDETTPPDERAVVRMNSLINKMLNQWKISPTNEMYQRTLEHLVRIGSLEDARVMLSNMQVDAVLPTLTAYSQLLAQSLLKEKGSSTDTPITGSQLLNEIASSKVAEKPATLFQQTLKFILEKKKASPQSKRNPQVQTKINAPSTAEKKAATEALFREFLGAFQAEKELLLETGEVLISEILTQDRRGDALTLAQALADHKQISPTILQSLFEEYTKQGSIQDSAQGSAHDTEFAALLQLAKQLPGKREPIIAAALTRLLDADDITSSLKLIQLLISNELYLPPQTTLLVLEKLVGCFKPPASDDLNIDELQAQLSAWLEPLLLSDINKQLPRLLNNLLQAPLTDGTQDQIQLVTSLIKSLKAEHPENSSYVTWIQKLYDHECSNKINPSEAFENCLPFIDHLANSSETFSAEAFLQGHLQNHQIDLQGIPFPIAAWALAKHFATLSPDDIAKLSFIVPTGIYAGTYAQSLQEFLARSAWQITVSETAEPINISLFAKKSSASDDSASDDSLAITMSVNLQVTKVPSQEEINNSVVTSLQQAHTTESLLNSFATLQTYNIEPTQEILKAAINSCPLEDRLERLEILHTMFGKCVEPLAKFLIDEACKVGNGTIARAVYDTFPFAKPHISHEVPISMKEYSKQATYWALEEAFDQNKGLKYEGLKCTFKDSTDISEFKKFLLHKLPHVAFDWNQENKTITVRAAKQAEHNASTKRALIAAVQNESLFTQALSQAHQENMNLTSHDICDLLQKAATSSSAQILATTIKRLYATYPEQLKTTLSTFIKTGSEQQQLYKFNKVLRALIASQLFDTLGMDIVNSALPSVTPASKRSLRSTLTKVLQQSVKNNRPKLALEFYKKVESFQLTIDRPSSLALINEADLQNESALADKIFEESSISIQASNNSFDLRTLPLPVALRAFATAASATLASNSRMRVLLAGHDSTLTFNQTSLKQYVEANIPSIKLDIVGGSCFATLTTSENHN